MQLRRIEARFERLSGCDDEVGRHAREHRGISCGEDDMLFGTEDFDDVGARANGRRG